jgi:hypothetical protein
MEAVYFSETLVSTYKSTRRYYPVIHKCYPVTNIGISAAVRTSNLTQIEGFEIIVLRKILGPKREVMEAWMKFAQ